MKEMLDGFFGNFGISVCFKDKNFKVQYQSPGCKGVCGDLENRVCDQTCPTLCNAKKLDPDGCTGRTSVHRNVQMQDGSKFDVLIVPHDGGVVSCLVPLEKYYDKLKDESARQGLTPRESEILSLLLEGKTNRFIAGKLFISTATLKSHINRIYRKIGRKLRYQ